MLMGKFAVDGVRLTERISSDQSSTNWRTEGGLQLRLSLLLTMIFENQCF